MLIRLGQCGSDAHVLNKTVLYTISIEGILRNETNISKPTILIEHDNNALFATNYMHIPDFNRYYYITDIRHIRNHLYEVSGRCDVLMSHAAGISISPAIIDRTTQPGDQNMNLYNVTNGYSAIAKRKTDIITFEDGFDDLPYFILITAGGIVS